MAYRLLIVEDTPELLEAISVFFARKAPGSGKFVPSITVMMPWSGCQRNPTIS